MYYMKRIKVGLFWFCLFNAVVAHANIIKVDNLESILPITHDKGQDTLLLLDIDYVISVPTSNVLRPCGQTQITNFIESFKDNPDLQNNIVNGLLLTRQETLIENNINEWLVRNKPNYSRIQLLTSFPIQKHLHDNQIEQQRYLQLDRMGFNVRELSPTSNIKTTELSVYNGIIFAKPKQKSQGLHAFLKLNHFNPHRIIFVDDRLDNLEDLQFYANQNGIHFTGYWYQGAEHLACKLDHETFTIQFQYLHKYKQWIEDNAVKPYCNAYSDPVCQIAVIKEYGNVTSFAKPNAQTF